MITIIDYGSGNVNAISNIYDILKIPYSIASSPKQLEDSEKIILPGVGSFDHCMQKLNQSGLKEILNKKVLVDKIPVLGNLFKARSKVSDRSELIILITPKLLKQPSEWERVRDEFESQLKVFYK